MASEGRLLALRRALLLVLGGGLVLLLAAAGWLLSRPVTPGEFVIRVVPAGQQGVFALSLLGPGGGKLADWHYVNVPGPSVLDGLRKKVPWTAIAKDASARRPCLTLATSPAVPEAAVAEVERLVLAGCCPGQADVARCPVRRVALAR
jgi:hypothetical protein